MKAIFKLEFLKFIKNPWALVFGVCLPIAWVLIIGYAWGQEIVNNVKTIDYCFPALVILITVTFSVSSVAIILCSDRLEKRIKQLKVANISASKYLTSLFLFNYCVFFIIFLIMLMLSILLFHLTTSTHMLLTVFFLPFIFFIIHFSLAIIIANNTNTTKTNMFVSVVVFYILIFLSGATIPSFLFGSWFKYLQYLSPAGCAVILLTYLANGFSTASIWFVYLIEASYLVLFAFLAVKTFKWE